MPLRGNPRQMLDPEGLGSPPANRYEVTGEVELIPTSQVVVGPNQIVGASGQQKSGWELGREKTPMPEKKSVVSGSEEEYWASGKVTMDPISGIWKGEYSLMDRDSGSQEGPCRAGVAAINAWLHDRGAMGAFAFLVSYELREADHTNPVQPKHGKNGGERSFAQLVRLQKEAECANGGAFWLGSWIMGRAFSNWVKLTKMLSHPPPGGG